MAGGTITRKDLITDEGLEFGKEYAKNIQLAIDANNELVASAKVLAKIANSYQKVSNTKDYSILNQQQTKVLTEVTGAIKSYENALKNADKIRQESLRISQKEEKSRLDEIRLQKAREKAFDDYQKKLEKEQTKLAVASNTYNKLQIELSKLSIVYKDLATKKELGATLTKSEIEQMGYLEKRIKQHDATLKAVDGTMGKYQRNVGNYGLAFNPLSNSINQLTREMPAFANSVQTGFMAISNNIPIFFDSMSQIIAQNKQLQAQGQPTQSVFKQLSGAIFSMGTALSVGVTLLTVYGKDIVEFFSNTSKAQENFKKNTQDVNATYTEQAATLSVVKEVLNNSTTSQDQFNKALKIAQQEGISLNAIEQARKGNLELLNDEISKSIDLSIKKAKADKLIQLIASQELENEKSKTDFVKAQTNSWRTSLNSMGFVGNVLKKFFDEKDVKNIQDGTKAIEGYKEQLKALGIETLLDDKKENASKKEKIALNYKEIQSIYELRKARLESQKSVIENDLNNENISFNKKIKLRQELSKKLIEFTDLDAKYQSDVNTKNYLADMKENALALKNKEISLSQYGANVTDINKRYKNEQEKVNAETSNKLNEIYINDLKFYGEIQDKELEKKKQTEKEKKEFTLKINELISNSEKDKYQKISDDENKTLEVRQQAFRRFKLLAIEELDLKKQQEIANAIIANKTDEEINFIIAKYDDLINKLNETKSPLERFQEAAKKANESFIKGFQTSFMNDLGLSNIQYLIDNFNTLKEDGTATALAIGEAFQDTFNKINEIANIGFERRISNIDAEIAKNEEYYAKEIELAGNDQVQKDLLQKEAESKRKKLEEEKRKEQQKQAIFNKANQAAQITISTIGAVMSALRDVPKFDFGISAAALAATYASIGAVQLATVLATPIPKYEKGTQGKPHKGGFALVGEKRPEVIQEPGKNPYIIDKPTFLNLKKGTEVIPSIDEWNALQRTSIMASLDVEINKIKSFQTQSNNFYEMQQLENKIEKGIEKGFKKARITINNNQQGFDLSHEIWKLSNTKWN